MTAFVLGNGISRKEVSVDRLLSIAPVYGCNALYRTYRPTVLVATDQHIAREIQESGYPLLNRFYTRRPLPRSNALTVPREYFGFSSGPIAVALAAREKFDPIYLIGFDLGPSESGKFNNVYADTKFYKPSHSEPTFTGNWVKQMQRIMADHNKQKFVRVFGNCTAEVAELDAIKNLSRISMSEFLDSINTIKEM
jgi:hypothetical protein